MEKWRESWMKGNEGNIQSFLLTSHRESSFLFSFRGSFFCSSSLLLTRRGESEDYTPLFSLRYLSLPSKLLYLSFSLDHSAHRSKDGDLVQIFFMNLFLFCIRFLLFRFFNPLMSSTWWCCLWVDSDESESERENLRTTWKKRERGWWVREQLEDRGKRNNDVDNLVSLFFCCNQRFISQHNEDNEVWNHSVVITQHNRLMTIEKSLSETSFPLLPPQNIFPAKHVLYFSPSLSLSIFIPLYLSPLSLHPSLRCHWCLITEAIKSTYCFLMVHFLED